MVHSSNNLHTFLKGIPIFTFMYLSMVIYTRYKTRYLQGCLLRVAVLNIANHSQAMGGN